MKDLTNTDLLKQPPRRLCSTLGMSEADWLAQRARGLGGSDAATVCGVNPWKTPFALWMEKTNRQAPPDLSDSESVHFGKMLESVVADEFERRSGLKVQRRNAIFQSAAYPWMLADVDRAVVGQNAGLECKTTSAYNGDAWESGRVPDNYMLQVQHYMAVMGWEACYIACLIGGQRFVWDRIERDEAIIAAVVAAEKQFWEQNVQGDVAPDITGGDKETLDSLFPAQELPDMLEPDSNMLAKARLCRTLEAEIKQLEDRKEKAVNELKFIIGENAGISGVCTWKQSKDRETVDWKKLALDTLAQIGESATPELMEQYTTKKPGNRPFKITLKEEQ